EGIGDGAVQSAYSPVTAVQLSPASTKPLSMTWGEIQGYPVALGDQGIEELAVRPAARGCRPPDAPTGGRSNRKSWKRKPATRVAGLGASPATDAALPLAGQGLLRSAPNRRRAAPRRRSDTTRTPGG